MISDFEKSAQRAAVDAVEQRWQRTQASSRNAARVSKIKSILSTLVLLAVVGVGGYFALQYFGIEIPKPRQLEGSIKIVTSLIPKGMSDENARSVDAFVNTLHRITDNPMKPWKSAPAEVKPKGARAGLKYTVLIEKKGGSCGLFEMVADGKGGMTVKEIPPAGNPVPATMGDFKKAKVGNVYLIECEGTVYVCGSDDVKTGRALVKRLVK